MINDILEQRGSRYGTFADHAVIAQSLIEQIRCQPNWMNLKPDARQALTVICDKIARMLNGDAEYDDNWVDIIGYATLVLNRIHADARKKQELEDLEDEKRAAGEGMTLGKEALWKTSELQLDNEYKPPYLRPVQPPAPLNEDELPNYERAYDDLPPSAYEKGER